MKTLEDLKALREKLKADMKVRQNDGTKIIIGMGTCGILCRRARSDVCRFE